MERWIGKLGSLHQYKGVDYVETIFSGNVCCLLCQTGWMPRNQRIKHFQGSRHENMYNAVRQMEKEFECQRLTVERLNRAKSLESRVNGLGLAQWRRHIKELMFEYVAGAGFPIDTVMTTLAKYERMERASLLELAIWKACICDGLVFCSIDEMRQYKILEKDFDTATYIKNVSASSGSDIIIPRVLEFL